MNRTGTLTRSETWSGTVRVDGDIVVPEGLTLTLQPGTRISFQAGGSCPQKASLLARLNSVPWMEGGLDPAKPAIIVLGALRAEGTKAAPVSLGGKGRDGSLICAPRGVMELAHCRLRHGTVASVDGGRIVLRRCSVSGARCGVLAFGELEAAGNAIGGGETGIICVGAGERARITGNVIRGNRKFGIVSHLGSPHIAGNRISGNDIGINCATSPRPLQITGNRIEDNRIGVYTLETEGCVIEGNSFARNTGAALLNHNHNRNLVIRRNRIRASGYAIDCQGSTDAEIDGNTIDGGDIGLRLQDRSRAVLSGGRMARLRNAGVLCRDMADLAVSGARIAAVRVGIMCCEETRAVVEESSIGALVKGIEAVGVASLTVRGSAVAVDKGVCLRYGVSAGGEATENRLSGDIGIDVSGTGQVTVARNRVRAGKCGASFREESRGRVEKNVFSGERAAGLDVYGIAFVEVFANRFRGLGKGARIGDEPRVRLQDNVFSCQSVAVECQGAGQLCMEKNRVASATARCVEFSVNAAGRIAHNELRGPSGIAVSGTCQVEIEDNVLRVGHTGISFTELSGGRVVNNRIAGRRGGKATGIEVNGLVEIEAAGNGFTSVARTLRRNSEALVVEPGPGPAAPKAEGKREAAAVAAAPAAVTTQPAVGKPGRVLVIAPRVPSADGNQGERRLYGIVKGLARVHEVHLLFCQALPTQEDESIARELAVRLIYYRKIRYHGSFEAYLENLVREENYDLLFLNTYFTAKYYLPYLLNAAGMRTVMVDAALSQCFLDRELAEKCTDPYRRINLLKRAEANRIRETAVYNYADAIIVSNEKERAYLKAQVPNVPVETVEGPDDAGRIAPLQSGAKRATGGACCIVLRTGLAPEAHRLNGENALLTAAERIEVEADGRSVVARCNDGLRRLTTEYGIVVTDRLVVPERSLRAMIVCAKSHPRHGLVLPLSSANHDHETGYEGIDDYLPKHFTVHFGNWHELRMPQQLRGCGSFLVSREVLRIAGLLDERFATLQYAVYDLSLRALQLEHRSIIANEAFVYDGGRADEQAAVLKRDHERLLEKWCARGTDFLESLNG